MLRSIEETFRPIKIWGQKSVNFIIVYIHCSSYPIDVHSISSFLICIRNISYYRVFFIVSWAPAHLAWSRLNKHLAPFLQWTLTGGVQGVQWRDNMLLKAVRSRYNRFSKWAHQMLYDYYTVCKDLLIIQKK